VHRLRSGGSGLKLERDQLTRAAYAYFALYGWFIYSFGPIVPLLRHEQDTSRAVAGLHGTAIAAGSMLSALVSVPFVRRRGRRQALLLACAVVSAGVVLLISLQGPVFTVPSAFLIGLGGALGLNAVNPVLADHHGDLGAGAIGEANAVAVAFGVIGPLAVGAAVALGLTWRGATAVTVPIAAVTALLVWRAPRLPALAKPVAPHGVSSGVPGRAFWLAWAVMIACVATEFCVTFWAADQLRTHVGLRPGVASACVSAVLLGMTIGRLSSVPLIARWAVERLLFTAFGLAVAGWALMWTATAPVVAVLGLFLLGLGLSLQFPLSLVRVMAASGGRPDAANALISLGTGLASGLAPFALGALADRVGAHQGFLLVPAFAVSGALLLALGRGPGARPLPQQ
jgi:predicted MFS family arabinose efflux permease